MTPIELSYDTQENDSFPGAVDATLYANGVIVYRTMIPNDWNESLLIAFLLRKLVGGGGILMNPADDDFESRHYREILEDFVYEHGVEPDEVPDEVSDLIDILLLNGWEIRAL